MNTHRLPAILFALLTLLPLSFAAAQSEAAKETKPAAAPAAPTLAPGNTIIITLKTPAESAQEISGKYTITNQGEIRIAHISAPIKVAGLTPAEIALKLEAAYKEAGVFAEPDIEIGIGGCGGGNREEEPVVLVGGEVKSGGQEVPLRKGLRLQAAITAAGGVTEFANLKRVKLIRGKKETVYDLRKMAENNDNNPLLEKNDQIIVPQD